MENSKNCEEKLNPGLQLQSLKVSIVALVKRKKLSRRMMHLFQADNLSMLGNKFRACFTLLEETEVLIHFT